VFLDEADYLPHNVQPPLRGILDEYSINSSFILTANYPERLIEPLRSRHVQIEFRIPPEEVLPLKAEYFGRLSAILESEGVPFEKKVLAQVVERYFPDMRQTLNVLQRYAASGPIDTGILAIIKDASVEQLIDALRKRNYTAARKWVANNLDIGSTAIFRRIYDSAREFVTPETLPQLIIILGKYQYQLSFVADVEINMAACVAEVIGLCRFLPV
jgi:replication factor C small subunit